QAFRHLRDKPRRCCCCCCCCKGRRHQCALRENDIIHDVILAVMSNMIIANGADHRKSE
ncbi:unnamed protein product, partial [Musa acuminata var. zebrina]